jgi:hypothetical protein
MKSRRGQVISQSISLLGIAAYVVPSPLGRLLLVSAGNTAGMLRQAPLWAGVVAGQGHVGYQAIGMSSGLKYSDTNLLTTCHCTVTGLGVSKQANRANNPSTTPVSFLVPS